MQNMYHPSLARRGLPRNEMSLPGQLGMCLRFIISYKLYLIIRHNLVGKTALFRLILQLSLYIMPEGRAAGKHGALMPKSHQTLVFWIRVLKFWPNRFYPQTSGFSHRICSHITL